MGSYYVCSNLAAEGRMPHQLVPLVHVALGHVFQSFIDS